MMIYRLVEKLRARAAAARRSGIPSALSKFSRDHVFRTSRYVFMYRDLAIPHKTYVRRRNWEIRILDRDRDLGMFHTQFGDRIKNIERLFDAGLIGGGAFVDNVLVGYGWIATKSFYDPHHRHLIELRDGEVYQLDVFLIPKYRGTLIVLDAMQKFHEFLFNSGYSRTICLVNIERKRNIKLHLKLGFTEMGQMLATRRLLSFPWSTCQAYEIERHSHPSAHDLESA